MDFPHQTAGLPEQGCPARVQRHVHLTIFSASRLKIATLSTFRLKQFAGESVELTRTTDGTDCCRHRDHADFPSPDRTSESRARTAGRSHSDPLLAVTISFSRAKNREESCEATRIDKTRASLLSVYHNKFNNSCKKLAKNPPMKNWKIEKTKKLTRPNADGGAKLLGGYLRNTSIRITIRGRAFSSYRDIQSTWIPKITVRHIREYTCVPLRIALYYGVTNFSQ